MNWACPACGGGNPEGFKFCGHCGTPRELTSAAVDGRVAEALAALAGRQPDASDSEGVFQERRLVTAVFADISGFTALADQVDEEVLAGVIDPLISRFGAIVAKYEGYIGKYAGDAVLALFGAPLAHEDDAARALSAALDMQAALEQLRDSLPGEAAHISLHVGVNTGYVVARAFGNQIRPDYSVLGDAVNVAQRLEACAPGGEIYVGASTRALASGAFDFEALPPLRVKGKTEELEAYRLLGRRVVDADQRAPALGTLVGRSQELAAITELLADLHRGQGGLVTVVGEPGLGKSRLFRAARALPEAAGLWWLEVPCLSYGSTLAYWPFVELLRQAMGLTLDQPLDEAASAMAASLALAGVPGAYPYFARLLGLPARAGEELDELTPEAVRRGLHRAFLDWLSALSNMQPLVLAAEDIHWCDSSSLELFAEVAALSEQTRITVWLNSRPEGALRFDEVAARVDPARHRHLELGPIGAEHVGEMVEELLGAVPDRRLSQVITERTSGNPFFVEEMVRTLLDSDSLERFDTSVALRRSWDPSSVPTTVEGVLAARLDLLPRASAEVLMTAAVIGRRVRIPLLRAVTEVEDLDAALDRLVSTGFLDETPSDGEFALAFHHALVQDVAYGRLLRRERQSLHLRTARAAESLYGLGDDVIDLLARHYYLGEAGLPAIPYLERAGSRARRLFANDQAREHLGRAVEVARRQPERVEQLAGLLVELAEVEETCADFDMAEKLFAEGRDLTGDVRAWRGLADVSRRRGQFDRALDLVDEAFSDIRLRDVDTTPLWLERTYALGTSGQLAKAIEAAEAGLMAARPDNSATGQLLVTLSFSEAHVGRIDSALEHGAQGRELLARLGDIPALAKAERMAGNVYGLARHNHEAVAAFERGLALAERVGNEEDALGCLVGRGLCLMRLDRLDEAIDCDRRALDIAKRIGHTVGQANVLANLAEKLIALGELTEAEEVCRSAIGLAEEIGSAMVRADGYRTLGRIAIAGGRTTDAQVFLGKALDIFTEADDSDNAAETRGLLDGLSVTATPA